jgi:hypothetical protein
VVTKLSKIWNKIHKFFFQKKKESYINSEPYIIDHLNRRQGTFKLKYGNNTISEIGNYKNDLKEGIWLAYWSDGTLKRIYFYYQNKVLYGRYTSIDYVYGHHLDVMKIYGNDINNLLEKYNGSPNAFEWEFISSYQFLRPEVIKKYKEYLIPEILYFFQNKEFFEKLLQKK